MLLLPLLFVFKSSKERGQGRARKAPFWGRKARGRGFHPSLSVAVFGSTPQKKAPVSQGSVCNAQWQSGLERVRRPFLVWVFLFPRLAFSGFGPRKECLRLTSSASPRGPVRDLELRGATDAGARGNHLAWLKQRLQIVPLLRRVMLPKLLQGLVDSCKAGPGFGGHSFLLCLFQRGHLGLSVSLLFPDFFERQCHVISLWLTNPDRADSQGCCKPSTTRPCFY